jgi:lipid-binding SYLF domain-containing protein
MTRFFLAAVLVVAGFAGPSVAAPPTPAGTLRAAAGVVNDFTALPLTRIPAVLLADAEAVAVFPNVVKAGFVVGGRHGHGVVLCRGDDGRWGEPTFVRLTGGGVGLQAGIEAADVILVFKKRGGLDRVLSGKRSLALGGDAAIAAGPVGRQAAAATDARLRAEIFSYSRVRGLFAGVSLDGSVIAHDAEANRTYARDGGAGASLASNDLRNRLAEAAAPDLPPRDTSLPPRRP